MKQKTTLQSLAKKAAKNRETILKGSRVKGQQIFDAVPEEFHAR